MPTPIAKFTSGISDCNNPTMACTAITVSAIHPELSTLLLRSHLRGDHITQRHMMVRHASLPHHRQNHSPLHTLSHAIPQMPPTRHSHHPSLSDSLELEGRGTTHPLTLSTGHMVPTTLR